MAGAHNIWSPSQLERNMKCPGSVTLNKRSDDETERVDDDKPSIFAIEGTLAHACCEALLKGEDLPEGYDDEMLEHAQDFANYVRDLGGEIIVEEKLVHPQFPEFGGTPDVLMTREVDGKRELHIIDFKYGKGLAVQAEGNYQLRGYLTLAMREHGTFDSYFGHIFQPRLGGLSFERWSHDDIIYFEDKLKAAMVSKKLTPGTHCRWCPALATCHAVKENALQVARGAFSPVSDEPSDWQFLMDNKDAIKALLELAPKKMLELMRHGHEFDNYKAVQSTGRTTWHLEEEEVLSILEEHKAEITVVKIKTPTQIKKLGIIPDETIDAMTHRPVRGIVCVPKKDRRKAVEVNEIQSFKED